MFLPPRVRSSRPKSRHAQRPATLFALPPRLLQAEPFFFAATKFESDAEHCCGRTAATPAIKKRMTSADVILL